ncbi:MAG: hypothetical protein ACPGJV_11045 [Bacteriovoracaceae bacterium]
MESKKDSIYEQNFSKNKFFIFIVGAFVLSLVSNLPIRSSIKTVISNQIYALKQCPMNFRDIEVSFLLPGVKINKLNFSGFCFGKNLSKVTINSIDLDFIGPSFTSLGAKFRLIVDDPNLNLKAYVAAGPSTQQIKFDDSSIISTELLRNVLGPNFNLKGNIELEGLIELQKQKLDDFALVVKSPHLFMPQSKVMNGALDLPQLNLGPFSVIAKKASSPNKKVMKLNLSKLEVGNEQSDININTSGQIEINQFNPRFSKAKLEGKIKFSQAVKEAIPLLKIYLSGKKPVDGFYSFTFDGPFNGKTKPKFK